MASGRKLTTSVPRDPDDDVQGAVGGRAVFKAPSTVHDYYLHNCTNVQIGPGTTMVFQEARDILQKEDQHIGLGKKDTMINSILNPTLVANPAPLSLQEVENAFSRHYAAPQRPSETTSFKEVYGCPLQTFLESDSNRYEIFKEKGVMKVRLKSHKKKKKKKRGKNIPAERELACSAEEEAFPGDNHDGHEEDQEDLSSEWKVITSKEAKKKQKMKDKAEERREGVTVVSRSISEQQAEALVRDLLSRNEGDQLVIYPDDSIYKESRGKFMIDVVSLWNTPQRIRSYILLGVIPKPQPPHTPVGLTRRMSNDFYRSQFLGDYFSIAPQFSYTEGLVDGKIIGVVEVGGSFATGSPAIPCRNDEEGYFREDELWIRSGKDAIICRGRDPRTTLVHQWFGGAVLPAASQTLQDSQASEWVDVSESSFAENPGSATGLQEGFLRAVQRFRRGHFALVVGSTSLPGRELQSFGAVDWVSVFDFDPVSRENGLLCHLEDAISKRRCLRLYTWRDTLGGLTESGIQWVCLRGLRAVPESHTPEDPSQWQRASRDALYAVCRQMARFVVDYTVLTLVVLWPEDAASARCMKGFIAKLCEFIDSPPPNIVLCSPREPSDRQARTAFCSLQDDCAGHLQWIKMDPSQVSSAIESCRKGGDSGATTSFSLPAADGELYEINERDAAWLREDLEVLYRENPYTRAVTDAEALQTEQDNFFRGGTLHWFAWYDLKQNHLDVERDIMRKILPFVRKEHLTPSKGGIVRLLHAPGSGGSTLAQRILWELRLEAPCAQVKQRSGSSFEELVSRIVFLHDKTHLPVVLLLDGVEETRLSQLSRYLGRSQVIFLYVRRYPYRIKQPCNREKDSTFFLEGTVSADEASRLAVIFSNRCSDDSKKQELLRLSKEVKKGHRQHYLFEFGMTVFHQAFRGVEAHVRGYLQLDNNPSVEDLLPWQRALGFLALVHYYSQSSIPIQFFAALFNKPPNYSMDLEDFDHPVPVFIVPDRLEGRQKNVRICHFLVSKELLEQLLNRSKRRTREQERLSRDARLNLRKFCFTFINQACSRKVKSSINSLTIKAILTRTFIFRDNRDVGEDEMQSKKRSVFSQIMYDMDSEPPYTEREAVLKKLTDAFPDDPNFHAHLGRFYAICRPEMEDVAEACLKRALDLCQDDLQRKQESEESMKLTLMHIHHMYGIIFQRRLSKYTGRSIDDKPEIHTAPGNFEAVAQDVVQTALSACENLRLSRENTPQGEEKCYAFGSEIHVRLQVCDFISRHHKEDIPSLLARPTARPDFLSRFVRESLTAIEDLVLECYSFIDADNIDATFQKFTVWYGFLFKGQLPQVDIRDCEDDIFMRRLAIAASKLKYNRNGGSVMESVTSREDLNFFVAEYERIFFLAHRTGDFNKRCLEIDYKEWLTAIRNPRFEKTYKIEYVMTQVRRWRDLVQSPTSKFYAFVLSSLLGFGNGGAQGNSENLLEAQIMQQEMVKVNQTVLNPRRPREWLGRESSGIRLLVPSSRIGHTVLRDLPGHVSALLAVCKGSICHPNKKKLAGYISLDLGEKNVVSVQVFFIPLVAELEGQRYAHHRVQFWLAFSLEHGYEAFGVRLLHRYTCTSCGNKTEITSEDDAVTCKCGARVEKSDDVKCE